MKKEKEQLNIKECPKCESTHIRGRRICNITYWRCVLCGHSWEEGRK